MIFSNFLHPFRPAFKKPKRSDEQLALKKRRIGQEAYLGGQIFGHLKKGCYREFFCLDANTWLWHEVWIDETTKTKHRATLRYDIRQSLVYKKQDDDLDWQAVGTLEKANLQAAISLYQSRVLGRLYPVKDWSQT